MPMPPDGTLYHGVDPGGITGEESDLTLAHLESYQLAAGKTASWVFFSHNWYEGRAFPSRHRGVDTRCGQRALTSG